MAAITTVFRRGVSSLKQSANVAAQSDPSFRRINEYFLGKRYVDIKQAAHGFGSKPSEFFAKLAPLDGFFRIFYIFPLCVYGVGVYNRGSKS